MPKGGDKVNSLETAEDITEVQQGVDEREHNGEKGEEEET